MPKGAKKAAPALKAKPRADPPARRPLTQYEEFHSVYPRSEGPPSISNGQGPAVLGFSSEMIDVGLDAGAFRAAWELIEGTAMARWPMRNSSPSAAAYLRAVEAFRRAWWARHGDA